MLVSSNHRFAGHDFAQGLYLYLLQETNLKFCWNNSRIMEVNFFSNFVKSFRVKLPSIAFGTSKQSLPPFFEEEIVSFLRISKPISYGQYAVQICITQIWSLGKREIGIFNILVNIRAAGHRPQQRQRHS